MNLEFFRDNYQKVKLEDFMAYIEENASDDKAWFSQAALNDKGVYNHFVAKKAFYARYCPDYVPVPTAKAKASDALAQWGM